MERDFVEDITVARKPDVCVVQYLLLILLLLDLSYNVKPSILPSSVPSLPPVPGKFKL
ncbi:hypothetical protein DY000_02021309 [Brassica cretica]|uniref:Uncharacterized protein n=1 Tax=Brassica cretica TaxID=69181 RepID=A0ABQ7EJM9_BRACR|nr:hypothetical protein DY000_02021309 [Brassica cretica]